MRIGFVGDIHEDAERLAEALRLLEKRHCDEIVCLGDTVGFDVRQYRYLSGRGASRCLDMVRRNCRFVLAGNHDLFAIRKLPRLVRGFSFPENWYQLDFARRKRRAEGRVWLFEEHELSPLLTAADREYLESLPEFIVAEFADLRVLLTHEVFPDPSGSLTWRPANHWDFRHHLRQLRDQQCQLGISGHLHPDGLGVAAASDFQTLPFRAYPLATNLVQYVCPCTAHSSSRNGFLVLDTARRTVEAVAMKSRRYQVDFFR
jgi:predicted phosphodiesterase